jgi:sigma-B regulation protein RsbU (phosphoserine phosphatase)
MHSICAVQPRILVADDQPDLIDALRLLLKREGIQIDAAGSPEAALSALEAGTFDLLLMDLNYTGDTTSGREGIDLLARVQALDRDLPIVVMTGWGSVDIAVEAMRRGVRNFVQKPWDNSQLLSILRAEVDAGRTRRREVALERRNLDEARRIQRTLLPLTMPPLEGWEIAVSWQPASGVGGDCFDGIAFGPGRVAISIADVVGKGIPAALLMSNLQATVRAFATDTTEPADLCQQVNRILCGHISEGRFISFFYGIVDNDESSLVYANAGHYPPVVIRANGDVDRLASGGPVLGVFPNGSYEQGRIALCSGDRILFYTDGITDVCNADDEEFGEARLVDLAIANRACSAPSLHARLAGAVEQFSDGRFRDDATLIVMAAE